MKNKNFIHTKVYTTDGEILDAGLYNSYRFPSYKDKIFLFSHGNGSWIGDIINSSAVKLMSKHGSVFLYDYRGYGKSTGTISDHGAFNDVYSVWKYLVETKKCNPNDIIIFGNSLGTSISANLIKQLVEEDNRPEKLPRALVLNNGFSNIIDVASEIVPLIGYFVVSDLHTDEFIMHIDTKIKDFNIIIMHSNGDEMIDINHAKQLYYIPVNNIVKFVEIDGTHNDCIYNEYAEKIIRNIVNRKILTKAK